MKKIKKVLSLILVLCLSVSFTYTHNIPQAKAAKKNVNKVIAQDENVKLKFKYIKNGQIYINVVNKSKEDLEIFLTWTNINGTFRYADDIFYDCYKDTNLDIRIKYYESDMDNYKYNFKKGKFQMLLTYKTGEDNGEIKEKQLKSKKITVK